MGKEDKEVDRTGMVLRDMSPEEREAAGEALAKEVKRREAVAAKKATHVAKWNEEIRQHDERIAELAEEVESGKRYVHAQMQFADVPRVQAGAAKSSKGRRPRGANGTTEAE